MTAPVVDYLDDAYCGCYSDGCPVCATDCTHCGGTGFFDECDRPVECCDGPCACRACGGTGGAA